MGLDCTAYSNLKVVRADEHEPIDEDEWCEDEKHTQAFAYSTFPRSYRGLEGWDLDEIGSGLRGGLCYALTEQAETFGFRAGSYGGYGQWRRELARFVGKEVEDYWSTEDDPDDLPFYELINFADNEGCIGPEAARDLLVDFEKYDDQYRSTPGRDQYDVEKYEAWTKACVLAAQSGLISLH